MSMKSLRDPACKRAIMARLGRIRAGTPRKWGTMTASQMVCHLSDCFLGVMGDKAMEIPARRSLLALMKPLVLYMPMKWPPGVQTRPEFEQGVGGTPPAEFESDMERLLGSLEKFTAPQRTFRFREHPMFGPMSERDWMRWGYLHCDHHLRQFGQ